VLYPTLGAVIILTSAVWFVALAAAVVVAVLMSLAAVAVAKVVSLLADIVSTFGACVTRMTCAACDAYDND
jgi:hypothetical protein